MSETELTHMKDLSGDTLTPSDARAFLHRTWSDSCNLGAEDHVSISANSPCTKLRQAFIVSNTAEDANGVSLSRSASSLGPSAPPPEFPALVNNRFETSQMLTRQWFELLKVIKDQEEERDSNAVLPCQHGPITQCEQRGLDNFSNRKCKVNTWPGSGRHTVLQTSLDTVLRSTGIDSASIAKTNSFNVRYYGIRPLSTKITPVDSSSITTGNLGNTSSAFLETPVIPLSQGVRTIRSQSSSDHSLSPASSPRLWVRNRCPSCRYFPSVAETPTAPLKASLSNPLIILPQSQKNSPVNSTKSNRLQSWVDEVSSLGQDELPRILVDGNQIRLCCDADQRGGTYSLEVKALVFLSAPDSLGWQELRIPAFNTRYSYPVDGFMEFAVEPRSISGTQLPPLQFDKGNLKEVYEINAERLCGKFTSAEDLVLRVRLELFSIDLKEGARIKTSELQPICFRVLDSPDSPIGRRRKEDSGALSPIRSYDMIIHSACRNQVQCSIAFDLEIGDALPLVTIDAPDWQPLYALIDSRLDTRKAEWRETKDFFLALFRSPWMTNGQIIKIEMSFLGTGRLRNKRKSYRTLSLACNLPRIIERPILGGVVNCEIDSAKILICENSPADVTVKSFDLDGKGPQRLPSMRRGHRLRLEYQISQPCRSVRTKFPNTRASRIQFRGGVPFQRRQPRFSRESSESSTIGGHKLYASKSSRLSDSGEGNAGATEITKSHDLASLFPRQPIDNPLTNNIYSSVPRRDEGLLHSHEFTCGQEEASRGTEGTESRHKETVLAPPKLLILVLTIAAMMYITLRLLSDWRHCHVPQQQAEFLSKSISSMLVDEIGLRAEPKISQESQATFEFTDGGKGLLEDALSTQGIAVDGIQAREGLRDRIDRAFGWRPVP